jgi:RimJ/RimL family protein N-acetyltransferase
VWAADKGIHRIELVVLSHNLSAIGLYKKMGYVEEGVRQQSSYLESQFVDEIYMAKLLK